MLTEPDILEALRACYATPPGLPSCNIIDLGCVDSITLTPDRDAPGAGIPGVPQKSRLVLTLLAPHPDEDAQSQLRAQILNRLAGMPALSQTTLTFATTPWTRARITPAGRQLLALDFPILNNRK